MRELLALYLLLPIIKNLGNVFAFLFQFVLARALTVGEVGFNALFPPVNILMAPANIIAFALSRTMRVANAQGELRVVVELGAMIGLAAGVTTVVINIAAVRPLGCILKVEHAATVVLR